MLNAYEKCEIFKWPKKMSIFDYLNNLKKFSKKLQSFKIELLSTVSIYQLLEIASISKATCAAY